jgi:hypothetical protein
MISIAMPLVHDVWERVCHNVHHQVVDHTTVMGS